MRLNRDRAQAARRFGFLIAFAVLYVVVFVVLHGLRFPLRGDELHFWPTSLTFSHSVLPTMKALRSYYELSTPLPFVLWGEMHFAFGAGPWLPRLVNLALSFAIISVVVWPDDDRDHRALAAVGVFLCPYFLIVSTHLYTDLLATFFSVMGVAAHLKNRYLPSAVLFALAIACRQYMVAFPAALVLWQLARTRRTRKLSVGAVVFPTLAALTLGAWFLFFHGFAPVPAVRYQLIMTASTRSVLPRNSLYFLACVGLYFVVPRAVLYRQRHVVRSLLTPWAAAAATGLLVAFVLFPPIKNIYSPRAPGVLVETMGYFDRALHIAGLPSLGRVAVFYLFAVLALAGLRHEMLNLMLVGSNALVMMKAHIAWDKYAVPLLVALWYLETRRAGLTDRAGESPPRSVLSRGPADSRCDD